MAARSISAEEIIKYEQDGRGKKKKKKKKKKRRKNGRSAHAQMECKKK